MEKLNQSWHCLVAQTPQRAAQKIWFCGELSGNRFDWHTQRWGCGKRETRRNLKGETRRHLKGETRRNLKEASHSAAMTDPAHFPEQFAMTFSSRSKSILFPRTPTWQHVDVFTFTPAVSLVKHSRTSLKTRDQSLKTHDEYCSWGFLNPRENLWVLISIPMKKSFRISFIFCKGHLTDIMSLFSPLSRSKVQKLAIFLLLSSRHLFSWRDWLENVWENTWLIVWTQVQLFVSVRTKCVNILWDLSVSPLPVSSNFCFASSLRSSLSWRWMCFCYRKECQWGHTSLVSSCVSLPFSCYKKCPEFAWGDSIAFGVTTWTCGSCTRFTRGEKHSAVCWFSLFTLSKQSSALVKDQFAPEMIFFFIGKELRGWKWTLRKIGKNLQTPMLGIELTLFFSFHSGWSAIHKKCLSYRDGYIASWVVQQVFRCASVSQRQFRLNPTDRFCLVYSNEPSVSFSSPFSFLSLSLFLILFPFLSFSVVRKNIWKDKKTRFSQPAFFPSLPVSALPCTANRHHSCVCFLVLFRPMQIAAFATWNMRMLSMLLHFMAILKW